MKVKDYIEKKRQVQFKQLKDNLFNVLIPKLIDVKYIQFLQPYEGINIDLDNICEYIEETSLYKKCKICILSNAFNRKI